ncbi:MAG: hypothetical protein AAF581_19005 [Planctomycetota bacterium]
MRTSMLMVMLLVATSVSAQTNSLTCSSAAAVVNSQVTLSVTLDHTLKDVQGYSFGLTHDNSVAVLTSISQGAAALTTNAGSGAEFFDGNIAPTLPAGVTGGGVVACAISLAPPFDVILGNSASEVATFTYDIVSAATTAVDFANGLGTPPVDIIVTANGATSIPASLISGLIDGTVVPLDFVRGDANNDGTVDISDAVFIAKANFGFGPAPACDNAADANDNDMLAVGDVVYVLAYLFQGGAVPAAPFPSCGVDGTPGALDCAASVCP